MSARNLQVGERVRLDGTKRAWKVRARGERYIVLTQPFNLRRTVLYTVIDLEMGRRGTVTSWACGFETEDEIAESLAMLERGDTELSSRNNVPLLFERLPLATPTEPGGDR